MHKEFCKSMDNICSELANGALWHTAAMGQFQKIALRGFARWNAQEAKGDFNSRLCLEKILRDKIEYTPAITVDVPALHWATVKELPTILYTWHSREVAFAEKLTEAMAMARDIDIETYKCLMCLADEVQQEAFRVKNIGLRLEMTGYDPHDLGVISRHLHVHFAETDSVDFDI